MSYSQNLQKFFSNKFGVSTADFANISISDLAPALNESIEIAKERIEQIANSSETPTFENTIAALDFADTEYKRVLGVVGVYKNQYATNEFNEVYEKEIAESVNNFIFFIASNKKLLHRVTEVKEKSMPLLNVEEKRLLLKTYNFFADGGAFLSEEKQLRIKEINKRLEEIGAQFSNNISKSYEHSVYHVSDEKDLIGIPQHIINTAKKNAEKKNKDGWLLPCDRISALHIIQTADNREVREQVWRINANHCNGGEFDNSDYIPEITNLRLELANLLGYETFAHFQLRENILSTPEQAKDFLQSVSDHALPTAQNECKEVEKLACDMDGIEILEPWDYSYHSKKLRKQQFDFDAEEMRPYLELNTVRQRLFDLIERLYDVQFIKSDHYPTLEGISDINVYELFDQKEEKVIGLLYEDPFLRSNKKTGAWMGTLAYHHKKDENIPSLPVCGIALNIAKPDENSPVLLSEREAETLYHEMGHALHCLFSAVKYPSLSGTSVPRDFVELPSQIMENFLDDMDFYSSFAKHHETGETIPRSMLEARKKSSTYGGAVYLLRQLGYCKCDMAYNGRSTPVSGSLSLIEEGLSAESILHKNQYSLVESVQFPHPFASAGYASKYYAYLLCQSLDYDAFKDFKENGLFDKATAQRFRETILSKGNSDTPMNLFVAFKGREPNQLALLEKNSISIQSNTALRSRQRTKTPN